jgi:hypothetical protein
MDTLVLVRETLRAAPLKFTGENFKTHAEVSLSKNLVTRI